ncbi:MAG: class I SAM-dependent methyltransferase [Brevundimonas sp.]|uniref:SAM-dependent methyltransferase n=1 Tax=Brevundimonas sp. TaxID=1871086 RepID=UPI002734A393|nr:class I SAM-dependent methyltransferase [Brevundimonas sp.]MDP3403704.1 class I SAM-dependent methyltransferase [Brevundimonas sp.]MDZ4110394.1 class I SAM-dependent methyltransferase [Brevundimonas sp.]
MDADAARQFWNSRYDRPDYLFGEAPNAFLASQSGRLTPGLTALVIADGEGRNGVWLAERGLTVTTTDIAPRAVEKALALAARRGVSLAARVTDLDQWDWPEAAFDLVVAIFIQFAAPDARDRLFARMKAALKPGGLILLQGYRPQQIAYGTGGPPQVENLYTESLLRDAFADFDIVHLGSHDSDISEGAGHAGRSALIDLVARRP